MPAVLTDVSDNFWSKVMNVFVSVAENEKTQKTFFGFQEKWPLNYLKQQSENNIFK